MITFLRTLSLLAALSCGWSTTVELARGDAGWQLTVDGQPFQIRGVTWSHTPIGYKYDYDLYSQPEAIIKATLDRDFTLMQAAGFNTIRGCPPAKWARYLHETYGTHFIVNDYLGRYGMMIDGKWAFPTNYGDPQVRQIQLERAKEIVASHKDIPGVIGFLWGNENNYALEWSSTEIENLPQGERHAAKARQIYAFFEEVMASTKPLAPGLPQGIVNGDIQYLELIAEVCPSLDIFGVNAYRGKTFSDLFDKVAATLDKPVVFAEHGADAWNALLGREDQAAQAYWIAHQFVDIYRHTPGPDRSGTCLGALTFQWADEWWKHGQQVRLDVHDTEATWEHGAMSYDHKPGTNNMNEEWFGICAISDLEIDGVHQISPRLAYYALQDCFRMDPFTTPMSDIEAWLARYSYQTPQERVSAKAAAAKRQAELPLQLITADPDQAPFSPSGYMGNHNAIQVSYADDDGSTVLTVTYSAPDNWYGIAWLCPANDWGELPDHWDLSGASRLVFQARGHTGGERVKFQFGLLKDAAFSDSASGEFGEQTLSTEWQEYSIPLAGKNLSRIKNGFACFGGGQGQPLAFDIKGLRFE